MSFRMNTSRLLLLSGLMTTALLAAPISETFTGALDSEANTPGSVIVEPLVVTATSSVTLFTTSYGGGMNLNGTTTPAGGFQPNVTLFSSTGFALAYENGQYSPLNGTWDAYVTDTNLAAGSYFVIMTDQNNQVSASFTGFGGLAPSQFYTLFTGPGGNSYPDVDGNPRDANYALNIQASPLASGAPEPATFWLVIPALAGAAFFMRKRKLSLS